MAQKNKSVVASVETIESEVVGKMEVTTEVIGVVGGDQVLADEYESAEEIESNQPSMLAGMLQQEVKPLDEVKVEDKPVTVQVEKNVGVGQFVRKLIADGMANKDILKIVHEQYGNKNTTYACVAWYRNKTKKVAQAKVQSTAVEQVTKMLEGDEAKVEVEETKTEA